MFRIKICGVTNQADAQAALSAGADAIGLNFYPRSKRYLEPAQAAAIARAAPPGVEVVGVFVNELAHAMRNTAEQVGLTALQLHGDEPPELIGELDGFKVVLARRVDGRGLGAIAEDLARCESAGRLPDAVLLDAPAGSAYGGTGARFDWSVSADHEQLMRGVPLILAGGLNPENVAEAIRVVRPHGVDVASGVESAPGKKDPSLIKAFVAAAKEALR